MTNEEALLIMTKGEPLLTMTKGDQLLLNPRRHSKPHSSHNNRHSSHNNRHSNHNNRPLIQQLHEAGAVEMVNFALAAEDFVVVLVEAIFPLVAVAFETREEVLGVVAAHEVEVVMDGKSQLQLHHWTHRCSTITEVPRTTHLRPSRLVECSCEDTVVFRPMSNTPPRCE